MVAEATPQNAPVTPTPSPDPVQPSGDEQKAPSQEAARVPSQPDGEDANQGDGGEEQAAPAKPAAKPLDQMTLAELDAKASTEALTAAEIQRRDALRDDQQRREFQRMRDLARAETERQQIVIKKTEALTKAHEGFIEDANAILETFGYEALPDAALELLQTRFQKRTGEIFDDAAASPLVESVRLDTKDLLVAAGFPMNSAVERNIGQMDLSQLMELHRELGKAEALAGGSQASSEPALPKDHFAVPNSEKASYEEFKKAQQNEQQASQGDEVPPDSRRRVPAGGKLTRTQFMAMTPSERAQAYRERPDEVDAL